jgi:hypothetical protein
MLTTATPRRILARIAILALSGAALMFLGDQCHVISGTTAYPPSGWTLPIVGVPAWIFPLFASTLVVVGLTHPALDRVLARPTRVPLRFRHVAIGLVSFLALWAASGFLPLATGGAKDIVLALGVALVWWLFDRTWQGLAIGAVTALGGVVAEVLLTRSGAFHYATHARNLFGVASWLPLLYVAGSVTGGNLGRWLSLRTAPTLEQP